MSLFGNSAMETIGIEPGSIAPKGQTAYNEKLRMEENNFGYGEGKKMKTLFGQSIPEKCSLSDEKGGILNFLGVGGGTTKTGENKDAIDDSITVSEIDRENDKRLWIELEKILKVYQYYNSNTSKNVPADDSISPVLREYPLLSAYKVENEMLTNKSL